MAGSIDRPTVPVEAAADAPAAPIRRGPEPLVGEGREFGPIRPTADTRTARGPEPPVEADLDGQAVDRVGPTMQTVDDAFPGRYDRSDCRQAWETDPHGPPEGWAAERNPGYPDAPGRFFNCGDCARASELTWRGLDTQAGALADPDAGGESLAVMDTWSPGERTPTDFAAIKATLEALGPGSCAIVAAHWKRLGRGHWFNAVNDDGVVKAVDGQSGMTERWPPTTGGLGFNEERCRSVEAIFVDPTGRHLRLDERKQV